MDGEDPLFSDVYCCTTSGDTEPSIVLARTVAVKSSPSDDIDGRNSEFPPSNLNQPPFVGVRMVMETSLDGGGSLSCDLKIVSLMVGLSSNLTCRLQTRRDVPRTQTA